MLPRFRNYTNEPGMTGDYFLVRDFLVDLGYAEFTYARWDWMATHPCLDPSSLGRIGLWEDERGIAGLATVDCKLGEAFCLTRPEHSGLKREMLLYARENLLREGKFAVLIPDTDRAFQEIAAELGFSATDSHENDAAFYIDRTSASYSLPEGFSITSMKDTFDLYQYRRVLYKGFNHELKGEGPFAFGEAEEKEAEREMLRPNVDLSLKVAVVSPEGNFVSYCGMWYEPKAGFAVVEPVATDPDYRRLGLGKAAVLEGIRRVGSLGAKLALVGSSQPFYYSIGFRPYATGTHWKQKEGAVSGLSR
jgi:GNAT superfamily N-acetyltransferase